MGGNALPFGLAAAGAGASGLMTGQKEADMHNQLMQMMSQSSARAKREQDLFPGQLTEQQNAIKQQQFQQTLEPFFAREASAKAQGAEQPFQPNEAYTTGANAALGPKYGHIAPGTPLDIAQMLAGLGSHMANTDAMKFNHGYSAVTALQNERVRVKAQRLDDLHKSVKSLTEQHNNKTADEAKLALPMDKVAAADASRHRVQEIVEAQQAEEEAKRDLAQEFAQEMSRGEQAMSSGMPYQPSPSQPSSQGAASSDPLQDWTPVAPTPR